LPNTSTIVAVTLPVFVKVWDAPTQRLARRVSRGGRIVLSGVRSSLAQDVERAYRHVGMTLIRTEARDGWCALTLHGG
jgi:ribosomal protein L11 methylase PrmA